MSKLCKKQKLLVSRSYDHGGNGLERGPLVFFRSIEEYNQLAKQHGWEDRTKKSVKTSWCVRPIEIEVLMNPRDSFKFFVEKKPLPQDKVFFPGNTIDQVYQLGDWY
jgi:hypothetical protein